MTQRSRTGLIISLVAIVLVVGVFGWLSKAGKLKIGADVVGTNAPVTKISYKQVFDIDLSKISKDLVLNNYSYDVSWTILNNVAYISFRQGVATSKPNIIEGVATSKPNIIGYNINNKQTVQVPAFPDPTNYQPIFVTNYQNQLYAFLTKKSYPSSEIKPLKLVNDQWISGGDSLTSIVTNGPVPVFNDALWNDARSKLVVFTNNYSMINSETMTPQEFDFSSGKWNALSNYNIPTNILSNSVARFNNDFWSFGGYTSTAQSNAQELNVVTKFINDKRIFYQLPTIFDHNMIDGAIAKNGNEVYLFGKYLSLNINSNGIVGSNGIVSGYEKYNIVLPTSSDKKYPAQKISPLPDSASNPMAAIFSSGKIYLLTYSSSKHLIAYEVQTGDVSVTTTAATPKLTTTTTKPNATTSSTTKLAPTTTTTSTLPIQIPKEAYVANNTGALTQINDSTVTGNIDPTSLLVLPKISKGQWQLIRTNNKLETSGAATPSSLTLLDDGGMLAEKNKNLQIWQINSTDNYLGLGYEWGVYYVPDGGKKESSARWYFKTANSINSSANIKALFNGGYTYFYPMGNQQSVAPNSSIMYAKPGIQMLVDSDGKNIDGKVTTGGNATTWFSSADGFLLPEGKVINVQGDGKTWKFTTGVPKG